MPNICHATAAVLGVEGEPLKWIESRGTKEGRIEMAWEFGEVALSFGLVVAGSYFTGGLGASLLLGSGTFLMYQSMIFSIFFLKRLLKTTFSLQENII
jgi:hypothetical protein